MLNISLLSSWIERAANNDEICKTPSADRKGTCTLKINRRCEVASYFEKYVSDIGVLEK